MPAISTGTNNPRIVRESEAWTVGHLMMRDDVSVGCCQLYGGSSTQCGLKGSRPINPLSPQLFSRMGLHITVRVQLVTLNRKLGKLPCDPTVRIAGKGGVTAGDITGKTVTSWYQKHPDYAVITGSSGNHPSCVLLSTFSVRAYGQIFFQETKSLCMTASLTNAV